MRHSGDGRAGNETVDGDVLSPRDLERAEAIMDAVSDDTAELFSLLRNGMTGKAGPRTGGSRDARGHILQTFGEIRAETYQEAAESARRFAAMCMGASDQVHDLHSRRIARCVAELFEEFAQRIDRVHPVAGNALREGGARASDPRAPDPRAPDSRADTTGGNLDPRRPLTRGPEGRDPQRVRREGEAEEGSIGLIVDNQTRR